jgi:predicted transcriptional regulator
MSESPSYVHTGCGGFYKFAYKDDAETSWFKCSGCGEVKSQTQLDKDKEKVLELIASHPEENSNLIPLEALRAVFHKWFKYSDETLLDLCLAVKIHSLKLEQFKMPLWLFIISASGDRKSSMVLSFLEDDLEEHDRTTYFLNFLTRNTLATGYVKNIEHDLAPKLNNKLVLTGDMAQFIKLHDMEKGAIWSQLREAYDGRVQKDTGSGVHTFYKDNFWDWLACSTHALDEELILNNELGTRELLYHMPNENESSEERENLMNAVWNNVTFKSQMREELRQAVRRFFTHWRSNPFEIEVSEEVKKTLFEYASFVTQLRVTAECDWRTGDLTNFVYPEKPTRIVEQLKMLFLCLKRIDKDYTDEVALARVFEVVKSSIHPIRLTILQTLREQGKLSTTQIARKVGLYYAGTNRELQVCRQLGILVRTESTNIEGHEVFTWELNQSHEIYKILEKFSVKPLVQDKEVPVEGLVE